MVSKLAAERERLELKLQILEYLDYSGWVNGWPNNAYITQAVFHTMASVISLPLKLKSNLRIMHVVEAVALRDVPDSVEKLFTEININCAGLEKPLLNLKSLYTDIRLQESGCLLRHFPNLREYNGKPLSQDLIQSLTQA